MKVLGIGESVIDNAFVITDSMKNHSLQSLPSTKHVGGPVLTALILLSKLGIDCTLVTSLGKDTDGEIIRRTLKHEKVKVLAKLQKKTKVNSYMIKASDGSREKIRGTVVHRNIKDLHRDFIRQFDIIIIDRHERDAFYEILEKKKPTAKIIIDPSTEISQFTLDMIKYADYPILPIEALTKIDGGRDLTLCIKKLYELSRKSIIITAGELGSIIYNGDLLDVIPALNVKAIDVQGAGDIYRGGIAYGVLHGWNLKKSAAFGNLVAGLQCTKLGNASAVPSIQEIENYKLSLKEKRTDMYMLNNYFLQAYE